jgi:hypothetical protein
MRLVLRGTNGRSIPKAIPRYEQFSAMHLFWVNHVPNVSVSGIHHRYGSQVLAVSAVRYSMTGYVASGTCTFVVANINDMAWHGHHARCPGDTGLAEGMRACDVSRW